MADINEKNTEEIRDAKEDIVKASLGLEKDSVDLTPMEDEELNNRVETVLSDEDALEALIAELDNGLYESVIEAVKNRDYGFLKEKGFKKNEIYELKQLIK